MQSLTMDRIALVFSAVWLFIILLLSSCAAIRKASSQIEESHNALYNQKALMVYAVESDKVFFTNPAGTRCYFLKGKQYTEKWEPGDTMIIENNLDDFYNLKFFRNCQ